MSYVLYKKLNLDICIIIDNYTKKDIENIKYIFKNVMNELLYTYWSKWLYKFFNIFPNSYDNEINKYNHRFIYNNLYHPIYKEIEFHENYNKRCTITTFLNRSTY